MAEVVQLATGQTVNAEGAALVYYQGEAATVGGYSIDGVEYPAKADVPATAAEAFDPSGHSVKQVREYLAGATPEEQQRVLQAEASGKARKALVGKVTEFEHPVTGEPMVALDVPADSDVAQRPAAESVEVGGEPVEVLPDVPVPDPEDPPTGE